LNKKKETTWCNVAAYDIADKTSSNLGTTMHNGDPNNTKANAAASNLAADFYGQTRVNNGEIHYYYDSKQNVYN